MNMKKIFISLPIVTASFSDGNCDRGDAQCRAEVGADSFCNTRNDPHVCQGSQTICACDGSLPVGRPTGPVVIQPVMEAPPSLSGTLFALRTHISGDFVSSWTKMGGPVLLEHVNRIGNRCFENEVLPSDTCVAYIVLATNIRLPGRPGSEQYENALRMTEIREFAHTHHLEMRNMLRGGLPLNARSSYNGVEVGLYRVTYVAHWLERLASVIGESLTLKRKALGHRFSRYTFLGDSQTGGLLKFANVPRISALSYSTSRVMGSGVITDLFTVVSQQALDPGNGVFELNTETLYYARLVGGPMSESRRTRLGGFGRIMAAALARGALLGISLPESFFARLLGKRISPNTLEASHPALRQVGDMPEDQVGSNGAPVAYSGYKDDVTAANQNAQI